MTERLSIMAAALLASERQHTRSFTIRRGDAIMLRDSIATRCGGVATTPRYGIGIMRYTSTVTIGHAPAGTALHTLAVTTRYPSTVTMGHIPAVTTLHTPAVTMGYTPAVTTLRGFATILHGSDITTLRGFAAGMVLTFVFSLCYNFVYNVMITERILDYCVDRISPSYPTHPQPRRG